MRQVKLVIMIWFFWSFAITGLERLAAAPLIRPAQWQQLTSDKAFNYVNDKEAIAVQRPADLNALQKLFFALFSFFGNGLGKLLLWTIVIAVVAFIVYKFLFSTDSIFFGRTAKRVPQEEIQGQDYTDIADTDWETLARKAAAADDYRLAVRYSYMWLLQLLQNRSLIQYAGDKTNFDYYSELSNTVYRQPFRQLSRQYEYVWYGQFPISGKEYDHYASLFGSIKRQLEA